MASNTNFIILTVVTLFASQYVSCKLKFPPLVLTKVGLIQGLTAEDGDYSMFLGIPYGQVDHGNPFGVSKPYPNFKKIFKAFDDSVRCPQQEEVNKTIGELDCLQLHIHVPHSANNFNRLPVLINIHGGYFRFGESDRSVFNSKYLMRHDVIFVSLNYRLGPYGFMCLDIPEVPGNQGLKDQALALRWIKNNIKAFGGDPNQMTVIGLSAGGHSIDFHLMFGDQNIFNRAILESGSSLSATVFIDHDKEAPLTLAKYLGFETESVYEAITFLSNSSTDSVIAASNDLGLKYKPCVEKSFDGVVPFVDKNWVKSMSRNFKNKTIMFGFAKDETILNFVNPNTYLGVDVIYNKLKALFDFDEEELVRMKRLVQSFYLGDQMINETTLMDIVSFDSDITYIHPIRRTIARYLENEVANIYYYMFAYKGGRNFLQHLDQVDVDGVSHGDEIGYLYDPSVVAGEPSYQDQVMIDRMTALFTNFVKFGNPTPEITELLPIKWDPVTKEKYNYLHMSTELSMSSNPKYRNMAFWDLFYALNEDQQKAYNDQ